MRRNIEEEQRILKEIEAMIRENPKIRIIDIANYFDKSYWWAYVRVNRRYYPVKKMIR